MNEMKEAIVQTSPKNDLIVGDALRNHLFSPPHSTEDLVARNIQRACEHGIPTYEALRKVCDLSSELVVVTPPPEMNQATWDKILNTFSTAHCWVG
jgi:hypothetical protein